MKIKTFIEGPIDANNYLIIDEQTNDAVLVDCSSSRDKFINEIKNLKVNLKAIFITHGHFDHTLGLERFQNEFASLKIYINQEDLEQIKLAPQMMQYFLNMTPVEIKANFDFVKDGDVFNFSDINVKAISTPGHTKGGMSYLINGNLFSGDTLFKNGVGRCDLQGGSFKEIVNSVKFKLFLLPDDTIVYTGHGEKTTIKYEKSYNEILNV